jgi:hypothetical protein
MEQENLDAVAQIKLIAKEMVGEPTSVKYVRQLRGIASTYSLYELEINEMRFYAVDIYNEGMHAAMMADDEQIEQIFGYEALPG